MDPGTDVDRVLHSLGGLGKYQKIQLSLLFVFLTENAFHLIASNYISYRPDYQCKTINETAFLHRRHDIPFNISGIYIRYGKCQIIIDVNATGEQYYYTCPNGYQYSIPVDMSTVTEWDLVCEGAARSELAQTLIMMGQAVGAAIFSPLSDKFGRKPINIIARVLYLIAGATAMFSPSIAVFSICRLLIGTFQGGSVMTGSTLCVEMLPINHRHRGEGLAFIAWTTGIVFTSMLGYFCRDLPWRYFQLILGLLSWHVVFDWMLFDESLRWLIANGKNEAAIKLIKKIATLNGRNYNYVINDIQKKNKLIPIEIGIKDSEKHSVNGVSGKQEHTTPLKNDEELKPEETVEKYSALTILKHKRILSMSIMLWFVWITNTLTYYGLMLMTSKLAGDRYLNNVLAALAEFPSIILQQCIINRIGRRYVLVMYHTLAGITLILSTICSIYSYNYSWLQHFSTVFSILGRFAAVGSFSSIFLYTPELYPTNLRNVGLGMASAISRIGSMIAPFASLLAEDVALGPAAIFVVMNIIVVVILLTLPETMGRELPTTVAEMKSWFHGKGFFDVKWPASYRAANAK